MTDPPRRIFRAAALERLATPEQLDERMQVARPREWVAVLTLLAGLLALLLWSWFGRVATLVEGPALLVQRERLATLAAPSPGQLAEALPPPGTLVRRGDPLARLAPPELLTTIAETAAEGEELLARRHWLEALTALPSEQRAGFVETERRRLAGLVEAAETSTIDQAQARNRLLQLALTGIPDDAALTARLSALPERLTLLDQRLEELQRQLAQLEPLRAPEDGRVKAWLAPAGALLGVGSPLLSLELAGDTPDGLEALLWLPAKGARQAAPGLEVLLAPSGFPWERYGYLRGRLLGVAPQPVSRAELLQRLGDKAVVEGLLAKGDWFEARATLQTDPATPSGLAWTAGAGPASAPAAGLPALAHFTLREQRPIGLAIPALGLPAGG
jgi:HlyD family secretion protein